MTRKAAVQTETRRKGSVIVMVVLFIPVLFAFMVASVDVGYFYAQKSRLQAVADMATLSALGTVNWKDIPSTTEVVEMRGKIQNTLAANGYPVDVFGDLNDPAIFRTYVRNENVEGIEIIGTASVSTFFYRMVNAARGSVNIAIQSRAQVRYEAQDDDDIFEGGNGFHLFGLDSLTFGGGISANSYNSQDAEAVTPDFGSNPALLMDNFKGGTLGDLKFNGSVGEINGSLSAGGTITGVTEDQVTGSLSPYDKGLPPRDAFPIPDVPESLDYTDAVTGQDVSINSEPVTFNGKERDLGDGTQDIKLTNKSSVVFKAGETYMVDEFDCQGGTIYIDGTGADPGEFVTIFVNNTKTGNTVNGTFQFLGGSNDFRLRIICTGEGGDISLEGDATQYTDCYAPGWDVKVGGTASGFGRAVGKTISQNGDGTYYGDNSLDDIYLPTVIAGEPRVTIPVHLVSTQPDPDTVPVPPTE